MTTRFLTGTIVIGSLLVGVAVLSLSATAPAQADQAVVAASTTTVALLAGDEAEYAGSNKCKMCHINVYKGWEETKHAKAYDTLKAGVAAEAKTKHGLDPQKDYTTDASCLACHTVGFGKKGGFEVVDDEKKMEKMVKNFGGIGCENCHGAGSAYADVHKAIKKEKKEYTDADMIAAGMHKITQETCDGCHNDKSPTYEEGKKVTLDPAKRDGLHPKEELELRKG